MKIYKIMKAKQKFERQISWVKKTLETDGEITRNGALRNYVTRLSGLIWWLKKHNKMRFEKGFFRGSTKDGNYSRDFVYKLK